jgi:tetratricopeptide (TPR) repeat protein
MLIRGGSIQKALELVKIAEAGASPYTGCLPSRLVFRPPFLRGMAHLRCTDPAPAVAELRHALILAGEDPLAQTVVRNLLGVSYYLLARPIEALRQHLHCFEAVEQDIAKDLSLRQNILRNLANDYWALNDVTQAICTYRKALRIASDLNDASNQAYLFWALAMAYRAANDQSLAKFYARRGIRLYEELDQHSNTALVSLQLIELLLREDKYDEVEELLAKTETNLSGTGNNVLLCKLHYNRADLLRRRGHLERAAQEAEHALALIRQDPEQHRSRKRKPVVYSQLHIVRTHAMALRAAALVAEAQGHQDRADTFFTRAAGLAGEIELIELVHTIAFSYADVLKARSNYKSAVEHYRLAARSAPGMVRPHI